MFKSKCLQFIFGLSLFFCLAFLSVPNVKASINVEYNSTSLNSNGFDCSFAQKIVPSLDKITTIIIHNADNGYFPINHAELRIGTGSGTLFATAVSVNEDSANHNLNLDFGTISVSVGTPYYLIMSADNGSSGNCGGYFSIYNYSEDLIRYKTDLATPSYSFWWNPSFMNSTYNITVYGQTTYCGDSICNGTETTATCPGDCPSPSMVMLFGSPNIWDNPTIFNKNQSKSFPVYWNLCDDYDSLNRARIYSNFPDHGSTWYDAGYDIIKDKTANGVQACKGNLIYSSTYTGMNSDATGTAQILIAEYDSSGNVIKTITSNTHSFVSATSTNFIDNAMDNPLMIDLGSLPMGVQTATSTSLFFMYNFTGLNTASTTVGLWDYNNATSTGYYSNDLLNSTGTALAGIVIPTPTINTNKIYKFYATTPGQPTLWSATFTVNWSFTPNVLVPYKCVPPTGNLDHVCDGIDTTTADGLGIHWGQFKCAALYATTATGLFFFAPSCEALNYFNDQYSVFKKGFPFNVYYDLTDSINTSIDNASSTGATSTIGIPFINPNATTTNKYYIMPIISSSSVSDAIGSDNKNLFRTTLGYVGWILCAVAVYFTVRKI
jgi:hypothetical protein